MPTSVELTNDGNNYRIEGAEIDRYIGSKQYTFTGVPCGHAFKFVAHGTGSYGCVPTVVSFSQTMGGQHYCGATVVYDFSACTAQQSSEFECAYHGRMASGIPRLTVNSGC
tara:strand:+ start:194 stop:526 length:333 start_codon:yes stop_codon:yes gene_type:complete